MPGSWILLPNLGYEPPWIPVHMFFALGAEFAKQGHESAVFGVVLVLDCYLRAISR